MEFGQSSALAVLFLGCVRKYARRLHMVERICTTLTGAVFVPWNVTFICPLLARH